MTGRTFILACLLCLGLPGWASAQTSTVPATQTTPAAPNQPATPTAPVPDPYTEDEFPAWALDLRRAEIIFFGSLPFTFLLAFEGVEVGRYIAHNYDADYTPFPFRSGNPKEYSLEENLLIIGSAVALSLVVALIDFIIEKAKPRPVSPEAAVASPEREKPDTPESPPAAEETPPAEEAPATPAAP